MAMSCLVENSCGRCEHLESPVECVSRYWELAHRNEVGLGVCVGGGGRSDNFTRGRKTGCSNQIHLFLCEEDQRVKIDHSK